MKIFNPYDPKHENALLFCRFNKALVTYNKLFESRCKRALKLINSFDDLDLEIGHSKKYYEIDKALEAAMKMMGAEDTHFALVSSDEYNDMSGRKRLVLLSRIHSFITAGNLH